MIAINVRMYVYLFIYIYDRGVCLTEKKPIRIYFRSKN